MVRSDEDVQKRMTGTGYYMQQTVTAGELDNFHVYEATKQRENEYMAQNATIMLKDGRFDE